MMMMMIKNGGQEENVDSLKTRLRFDFGGDDAARFCLSKSSRRTTYRLE